MGHGPEAMAVKTHPVAVITEAASTVIMDAHTADAEKMPQTTVANYQARKWPA